MLKRLVIFISPLWIKPVQCFRSIKKGETKKIIQEQIFRSQDTNLKIATAVGFGIFMGIFPIWGFQMLTAVFLAALFRLNKFIVLLVTNISFPPLIPFWLYLSYISGGFLLNQPSNIEFDKHFNLENIQHNLFQYYIGAVLLACVVGLLSGVIAYFLLNIFRKKFDTKSVS